MPYKDPEKARECYRLAQARLRDRKRAVGLPIGNNPEYMRSYYEANREVIIARSTARNNALAEAGVQRLTRSQIKAQTSKRRARKKNAPGVAHTAKDLDRIMAEQNFLCVYCESDLRRIEYHADHKTPLSRGGSNSADNMQMLCAFCNMSKHARTHEEHLARLRNGAASRQYQADLEAKQHICVGLVS